MTDGAKVYAVPKGTNAAKCPRGCGVPVYWVEVKRHYGTTRIPVDTTEGAEPDSWSPGSGVNHFDVCAVEE